MIVPVGGSPKVPKLSIVTDRGEDDEICCKSPYLLCNNSASGYNQTNTGKKTCMFGETSATMSKETHQPWCFFQDSLRLSIKISAGLKTTYTGNSGSQGHSAFAGFSLCTFQILNRILLCSLKITLKSSEVDLLPKDA